MEGDNMSKWRKLDMASKTGHPPADMLVALYLDPTNGRSTYYRHIEYDVGCFKPDSRENSRKLWWHGTHSTQDPTRMKKHYTIWWCPVPEYDGL